MVASNHSGRTFHQCEISFAIEHAFFHRLVLFISSQFLHERRERKGIASVLDAEDAEEEAV